MPATALDPALLGIVTRAQRRRLSMPAFALLLHLRHREENQQPPPSMKQAALILGCSTAAVTGLADAMEARGLIERVPAADDRRTIFLFPTEAGKGLLSDILAD